MTSQAPPSRQPRTRRRTPSRPCNPTAEKLPRSPSHLTPGTRARAHPIPPHPASVRKRRKKSGGPVPGKTVNAICSSTHRVSPAEPERQILCDEAIVQPGVVSALDAISLGRRPRGGGARTRARELIDNTEISRAEKARLLYQATGPARWPGVSSLYISSGHRPRAVAPLLGRPCWGSNPGLDLGV